MENKKGVSPVIATILLVMIVIILAIIILLWTRGFIKEAITKEINGQSKNVEMYCSGTSGISIKGIINEDGTFGFQNEGNVPISKFKIKTSDTSGSSRTDESDTPVNPGFSIMIEGEDYNSYDEIIIIPIILGKKANGEIEPYECPEIPEFKIYSRE